MKLPTLATPKTIALKTNLFIFSSVRDFIARAEHPAAD
jgi:hypothetical protein